METLKKRCVEIYEETQMGTEAIIQHLLQKGSQPQPLVFGRDPEASRREGKL